VQFAAFLWFPKYASNIIVNVLELENDCFNQMIPMYLFILTQSFAKLASTFLKSILKLHDAKHF